MRAIPRLIPHSFTIARSAAFMSSIFIWYALAITRIVPCIIHLHTIGQAIANRAMSPQDTPQHHALPDITHQSKTTHHDTRTRIAQYARDSGCSCQYSNSRSASFLKKCGQIVTFSPAASLSFSLDTAISLKPYICASSMDPP